MAALSRLIGFMVLVVGLAFVVIEGCGVVADEAINGDRRDTSRCPPIEFRPGAVEVRVSLSGFGNPDLCLYFDADGNEVGSLLKD